MQRVALLLLATGCMCFGQLDSNSVTIQVSRASDVQPDVATLSITVTSSLSTGLDQVVAALQGTGITSANLAGVNTITGIPLRSMLPETSLAWTFSLSVPFAALKNTAAMLSTLQAKLTFSVQGSDVSPQLLAAQKCSIPDLINGARAQAKKLTDAAGLGLGPILALADSPASAGFSFNTPRVGILSFSANGTGLASFLLGQVTTPVSCLVLVKFGLLRN